MKTYPELSDMGESEAAYDRLGRAIIEAWKAFSQEYIDGLIEGMKKRVETLRLAKDCHTKYWNPEA